ncbi:MAG: integrase [Gammaproteobacteria bacterium]|nr:integrase [Gammaproteobacteria bacterium]MDE0512541.1 integrase [Gammaproteobacteria bacterium]
MSMMNMELYDALISVNVPEVKARKAAMSILGHDQVATKADIAEIKADIRVLKWMVGVNMALTMGLIWHAVA